MQISFYTKIFQLHFYSKIYKGIVHQKTTTFPHAITDLNDFIFHLNKNKHLVLFYV